MMATRTLPFDRFVLPGLIEPLEPLDDMASSSEPLMAVLLPRRAGAQPTCERCLRLGRQATAVDRSLTTTGMSRQSGIENLAAAARPGVKGRTDRKKPFHCYGGRAQPPRPSAQPPNSFAFAAWNSASVRAPDSFSLARRSSWAVMSASDAWA